MVPSKMTILFSKSGNISVQNENKTYHVKLLLIPTVDAQKVLSLIEEMKAKMPHVNSGLPNFSFFPAKTLFEIICKNIHLFLLLYTFKNQ